MGAPGGTAGAVRGRAVFGPGVARPRGGGGDPRRGGGRLRRGAGREAARRRAVGGDRRHLRRPGRTGGRRGRDAHEPPHRLVPRPGLLRGRQPGAAGRPRTPRTSSSRSDWLPGRSWCIDRFRDGRDLPAARGVRRCGRGRRRPAAPGTAGCWSRVGSVGGARRTGRARRDAERRGGPRATRGDGAAGDLWRPRGLGREDRRRIPLRDPRLLGLRCSTRRSVPSPATTPTRSPGSRSTRWPRGRSSTGSPSSWRPTASYRPSSRPAPRAPTSGPSIGAAASR